MTPQQFLLIAFLLAIVPVVLGGLFFSGSKRRETNQAKELFDSLAARRPGGSSGTTQLLNRSFPLVSFPVDSGKMFLTFRSGKPWIPGTGQFWSKYLEGKVVSEILRRVPDCLIGKIYEPERLLKITLTALTLEGFERVSTQDPSFDDRFLVFRREGESSQILFPDKDTREAIASLLKDKDRINVRKLGDCLSITLETVATLSDLETVVEKILLVYRAMQSSG